MDADLLRTLRGLSMYQTVWDREDEIDLADPESRLEFVRMCRDTERFHAALPLVGTEPAADSRALAEQLAVLDLVGDSTQLAQMLSAARRLLERTPAGARPDPFLSCAAARAEASFGRLRGGLRVMGPHYGDMRSGHLVFSTYMFLYIRLGWYRATYKLIHDTGDLDRGPDDTGAAGHRLHRLVSAARALGRIGDLKSALAYLERAKDLSAELRNATGASHPWMWRWYAYVLRTNALWDRFTQLRADAERTPLWTSAHNPVPAAMIADSSPFQVELAMEALTRFDGTDPEALTRAVDTLGRTVDAFGSTADTVQATGALLHVLDDDRRLLRHARSHPYSVPPRIEYIRMLAERGMLEEAAEAVGSLLADRPRNPEALQLRVGIDADRLEPTRRVDTAHDLLAQFPEDAPALAITAERLAQNGHFRDSETLFAHLTGTNPVYGLGWAGRLRAATWGRAWDRVAAIERQFERRTVPEDDRGIEGNGQLSSYWFAVAKALARATQMDFDAADAIIDQASGYWRHQIEPEFKNHSNDPLWSWTVERHQWRHRIDAAANRCQAYVERAPENPYFRVKYGWVLLERLDYAAAEQQFLEALRTRPGSSGVWKGLIRSLRQQLRFEEAHAYAARAKRVLRPDPDIWCEHAELYLAEHDPERALAVLDDALRFAPNHANTLAMRVHCLAALWDHAGAITESSLARARRPESIEVLEAHCKALLRRGWDQEARKVMVRAREDLSGTAARTDLAVELLSAGVFAQCGADLAHCEAVIANLERHRRSVAAIATAASLRRVHLQLERARALVTGFQGWEGEFELLSEYAEIMAAHGRNRPAADAGHSFPGQDDDADGYSLADASLAAAARIDPYSLQVTQRQVHLWNAQKRFDDSLALLSSRSRRFGSHFMIELLTAETHVMRGRPDTAIQICDTVMERFRDRLHQPIRLRIAHLRSIRATGDLRRALELAEQLVADRPASRRARLTLARSLEDFNRTSEALDHLERCLLELPLYPPIGENAALFCRLRREFERGHRLVWKAMRHYDHTGRAEDVYQRADSGLLAELVLILAAMRKDDETDRCIAALKDRDDVYSTSLGHISAGWIAIQRGELASAVDEFNHAIDTGMCVNEARYGLGQTHLLRADTMRDSDSRRVLLDLVRACAQKNIDAADSERSYILAGRASYLLDNWVEAESCFRKSIAQHRVHGAHLELAVILNHRGRLTEALVAAENGAECAPTDPRLLAVTGLTRLRLVVEQHHERVLLEQAAIEIDRALDADPADPTVLSAVVYAANHTDLYLPTTAHSYLEQALHDARNRSSTSTMKHLHLMLAELTLRYRRVHGMRVRWGHGPRYWARQALKYTDDPRAKAITESFWPRRRTARVTRGRLEERRNGDAGGQRQPEMPKWLRHAIGAVGLAAVVGGAAAAVLGVGGLQASAVAAIGAGLAFVGLFADRLHRLAFRDFTMDISPATEMAGTLNLPVGLPVRAVVMPQTPVHRSDAQWRIAEAHRQLLGPAVGPMITGHYTYRDANFPWKTR